MPACQASHPACDKLSIILQRFWNHTADRKLLTSYRNPDTLKHVTAKLRHQTPPFVSCCADGNANKNLIVHVQMGG